VSSVQQSGTVSITRNLNIALEHLCYKRYHRSLWIDALCIDQADLQEKSIQVLSMGVRTQLCPTVLCKPKRYQYSLHASIQGGTVSILTQGQRHCMFSHASHSGPDNGQHLCKGGLRHCLAGRKRTAATRRWHCCRIGA
jgi:hypothetical protein